MGRQYFSYIILGIAVLLFLVTMIKDWRPSSKKEEKERSTDSEKKILFSPSKTSQDTILPLCLQAYERLVVFLERVKIETLIRRLSQPDLTVHETAQLFIESIRTEYDHNVSQQIYVSVAAWEAVSTAKEQLIRSIHLVASQMDAREDGNQLCRRLLSDKLPNEDSPIQLALDIVNNESKKLMAQNN